MKMLALAKRHGDFAAKLRGKNVQVKVNEKRVTIYKKGKFTGKWISKKDYNSFTKSARREGNFRAGKAKAGLRKIEMRESTMRAKAVIAGKKKDLFVKATTSSQFNQILKDAKNNKLWLTTDAAKRRITSRLESGSRAFKADSIEKLERTP